MMTANLRYSMDMDTLGHTASMDRLMLTIHEEKSTQALGQVISQSTSNTKSREKIWG